MPFNGLIPSISGFSRYVKFIFSRISVSPSNVISINSNILPTPAAIGVLHSILKLALKKSSETEKVDIWSVLHKNMSHLMTKPTKWYVCPAKTQISLGIRPVWSESSLCAQWVAEDPMFRHADSKDSDQTGRMPRLIWPFAGHTSFCWFCHEATHICSEYSLTSPWQCDSNECQ